MTDEQIIKNLKEITDNKIIRNTTYIISLSFLGEILDLINRKKAEIESLKQIIYEDSNEIIELHRRIVFWQENLRSSKSEAIKEFAERLKNKIWYSDLCNLERTITPEIITNLVKEMTEVQE